MTRLRPLLACLILAFGAPPGLGAGAPVGPATVALQRQPDGTIAVEGAAYRALIGADGNLHSLRVDGAEMLDDQVAISLGAFFFASGLPRKLDAITFPEPNTVEATDGTYTARYRFSPTDARITLRNAGRTPVPYYVVLSPAVSIVANLRTGEAAASASAESWGDVRFSTAAGAYLDLLGGTRIWGPWLGRQVWEISPIPPQGRVDFQLRPGVGKPPKAALEQLVGARVQVTAPHAIVHIDNPIELQVAVENRSEAPLSCQLSMEISGSRHDQVIYDSASLQLPPKQTARATFQAQVHAPDFYRARISVTAEGRKLTDARAAAGYRVAEILPTMYMPPDFPDFWQRLIAEVAQAPLDFRLDAAGVPRPRGVAVWLARYASVGETTIYGWYAHPQSPGPHPAILYLPGYGSRRTDPPIGLARRGYAVLAIDSRGNRVDQPRPPALDDYATLGLESPETYVYRDIVAHSLRAISFLASRREVDPNRIAVVGVSEGGGVGLILAALSPRVRAVAADAPLLCDFPLSVRSAAWPYTEIARSLQRKPDQSARIYATLAHFDVANFAPHITCPVLLSAGFLDPVSLPAAVYGTFNLIAGPKEIRTFPETGHEGGGSDLWEYKLAWLARNLLPEPRPAL